MYDKTGAAIPSDFVSTGNNHHVAIFIDSVGNLQEHIVPFFDVVKDAIAGRPFIDYDYNKDKGWKFLFTMKQNEYFVFPNVETGFDPEKTDLMNTDNYSLISPNLFRVQKLSSKYYVFRHHLDTTVDEVDSLRNVTWKRIRNANGLKGIVKVRINHLGKIVHIGE